MRLTQKLPHIMLAEMNEDLSVQSKELQAQAIDYVASSVKLTLGAIPVAGPLLAEIAGSAIPNQRLDRIADFAQKLGSRIDHLEQATLSRSLKDEKFTDLAEEAMLQAARAVSDERRRYLASLVGKSLSNDEISHEESKHLLRMLNELNDVEVLWLRYHQTSYRNQDIEFKKRHAAVFDPIMPTLAEPQARHDAKALQESYKSHLERLGLLTRKYDDPDTRPLLSSPDRFDYVIAPLGRLLLRTIDLYAEENHAK